MFTDSRYGTLRQHQAEALEIANRIAARTWPNPYVFADVTPGGGKTFMAAVFTHVLLLAGIVDRVLWIVPRDNLRQQVRRDFHNHARGLTKEIELQKGSTWKKISQISLRSGDTPAGLVTTYHTVAASADRAARWVASGETLVILDECHHLPEDGIADVTDEEEGAWTDAVRRVVVGAAFVLGMSGTADRHDGKAIAFLPYALNPETGKRRPQFDIQYSRRRAIEEKAIVPIYFGRQDGKTEYQHLSREHEVALSEAKGKQVAKAVRSVLQGADAYRFDVIRHGLGEWIEYRKVRCDTSRAIIIADTQKNAREYVKMIEREFPAYRVALAISSEPGSAERIRQFRDAPESFKILVTVGMAHEGLDVPDCTHLVYLSDKRSRPWMEQAIARVTRFDPRCGLAWEEQLAHVYLMDTTPNQEFIEALNAEQGGEIDIQNKVTRASVPRGPSSFVPGNSERTLERISYEDSHLSPADTALYQSMVAEFPWMRGAPLNDVLRLARKGA